MSNVFKYVMSGLFCNLLRLLKFIPNNDPIMGCMLPFAKQAKWWHAALFSLLVMVSFDFITGSVGVWTLVTGLTYAGLGVLFYKLFKNKEMSLFGYLKAGVLGVLIYDFITGPIMSSWLFSLPFEVALIGQIPFTLLHLATASGWILIVTPFLDKHLVNSPRFTDVKILEFFKKPWVVL